LLNTAIGLIAQVTVGKNWVLIVVILLFAFGHMALGAYLKTYDPAKFQEVNYPYTRKDHWREGFVAGGVCLLSAIIVLAGFVGYLFLIPGVKDQVFSAPNPQAVIDSWLWVINLGFAIMAIYIYHWGRLRNYKETPAPSRIKLRSRKKSE
jgi:hypothetical protein